jgi:hypothetical protein
MSLYIYCPRRSNGALELVKALGAKRLRRFDGLEFWDKKKPFSPTPADAIICWGSTLPELEGIRVLNGLDKPVNKAEELSLLTKAGVPTIRLYGIAPADAPKAVVLPRRVNHLGGHDLLHTPKQPDYYVIKEDFVKEYRIHSFNQKSIRAGIKVPREGYKPVEEAAWKEGLCHPWIRSFDAGWRVNYDGFKSNAKLRRIAHQAVKALGLSFGAVDIGEKANGNLCVLEVNRAPGIEGNTIQAYVRAITKWLAGEKEPEQPTGEPVEE